MAQEQIDAGQSALNTELEEDLTSSPILIPESDDDTDDEAGPSSSVSG